MKENVIKKRRSGILADVLAVLAGNKKKVMPVVLFVCMGVAIIIALCENSKPGTGEDPSIGCTSDLACQIKDPKTAVFEQNAYPEVNALMTKYFDAYVSGDTGILDSRIYRFMDENEAVMIEERARYIDSIDNLTVYSMTGPIAESLVVYVYTDVKYAGCDDFLPGLVSFYVCRDAGGEYYIKADEREHGILEYIKKVSLRDEVVDLYNQVNTEYADRLEKNELMRELVASVYSEIAESVGERLAGVEPTAANVSETASLGPIEENGAVDTSTDSIKPVEDSSESREVRIRAKTVVNVRKSDSTEADILGKTKEGDEYVRIVEQKNGWTKISFAGGAAYVKTEYFEIVEEDD